MDDGALSYSTIIDTDKITNFWSDDEIKSIAEQFSKCFKDINELESNDTEDENQSTTSNTSDNTHNINSILPIPRNKLNPMVSGYLVGIEKILDLMDQRFIAMLDKSVNGSK